MKWVVARDRDGHVVEEYTLEEYNSQSCEPRSHGEHCGGCPRCLMMMVSYHGGKISQEDRQDRPTPEIAAELAKMRDSNSDLTTEEREWLQQALLLLGNTTTLTCVFCGLSYPLGTPPSGASALEQHVRTCEKHPLSKMTALARELAERLEEQEVLGYDSDDGWYWKGDGERIGLKRA